MDTKMNTKAYEKLLSELGIPSDWSPENREAMLEKKCGEALELLNVAQQRGETDKVKQLEDRIAKMGDAIEHTKELQKHLSSGLILDIQNEKDRLKELKEAGKEKAQTVRELAGATQPGLNSQTGQPATQPISNSQTGQSATQPGPNALTPQPATKPQAATPQPVSVSQAAPQYQGQFRRAGMELEDKNWEKAKQLYNDILDADPENAEANLGLFMANRQISGKKHIPEAARSAWKNNVDLFQDSYFLRTKRFANAALKKELGDMEKGRDYLLAVEELQRATTDEGYQKAEGMFAKFGDFADAKTKRKEAKYKQAEYALRQANRMEDFLAVKKLFAELGDYSDSQKRVEGCERKIKQLQEEAERKERERREEAERKERQQREEAEKAAYQEEYLQFKIRVRDFVMDLRYLKEREDLKEYIEKFEKYYKDWQNWMPIYKWCLQPPWWPQWPSQREWPTSYDRRYRKGKSIRKYFINVFRMIMVIITTPIVWLYVLLIAMPVDCVREVLLKKYRNAWSEVKKIATPLFDAFVDSEYQKIYDKYPEVGSERKEIEKVRKELRAWYEGCHW